MKTARPRRPARGELPPEPRRVVVEVGGRTKKVPVGTPVGALLPSEADGKAVLAARIDALVVDLSTPVLRRCRVAPVTYGDRDGNDVYRHTLTFLLSVAARKSFPDRRVSIGHSLAGGYYYDVEGGADAVFLTRLRETLEDLIRRDLPIEKIHFGVAEAIEHFARQGRNDKVRLLRRFHQPTVEAYRLEGVYDVPFGPLALHSGATPNFALVPYPPGFVLRFPDKRDLHRISAPSEQTRLFSVYHESKRWSRVLGIENVADLNDVVAEGNFRSLVHAAEALHERKIAEIADAVAGNRDVRVVVIAGPSSSGKTTFSKRLAVHLRVAGLRPHPVALDDYFVDRERTPRDAEGEYDFEALEALDLDLLNDHLEKLLAGREVTLPKYDFKTGRRRRGHHALRLAGDDVLILEGIHGLNDALMRGVPRANQRKIYVSALTQLTIDDTNRIPTTDTRLLRRIVRDRKFRGYSAIDTIRRWPSVTRGEARNIFPFQETADWMFNTALLYELAVIKPFARRALEEVSPEEPEMQEVRRLLAFLDLFLEADPDPVPPTSILREFIGGSSFRY